MEILEQDKKRIGQALFVFLIILCAYFAVRVFSEVKMVSLFDESAEPATVSFSGHGEVTAVPDIANIYFTISKDAATVKEAQASVAAVEKKALDILKAKKIEDKDIKTTDASFSPKYEYKTAICPQPADGASSYYCGGGKQVIVGYTASESINVKVRNTDDAATIMQELGATGVSNLNGPSFAVDNEDGLKAEARKKAIDDAKMKAESLAKDLGVKLGKIRGFSEPENYPIYAGKAEMMSLDSVRNAAAPAQLPKGENIISSDVTITYELK
ncbi:MAG TPA: SIMPL domain-containing protein [Candidatus Paceibacterota bacterium]